MKDINRNFMKYYYLSFIVFLIFSCTKEDENNVEFISLEINSWGKSDYNDVQIFRKQNTYKLFDTCDFNINWIYNLSSKL